MNNTNDKANRYSSTRGHSKGVKGLHKAARHRAILARLTDEHTCSISDLAHILTVSDETIRRDVRELSAKGFVTKVHGAIILPDFGSEQAYQKRLRLKAREKIAIAKAAATLIPSNASLMIDTGSTTMYFARSLSKKNNLVVITNCTEIARTIASNKNNEVYLAGGALRADDDATFGTTAISFIEGFRADYAVLSIGGLSEDSGIMDYHLEEAEIAQAMIKRTKQVIVLADSSKFNRPAPVWVDDWRNIDILFTDANAPKNVIDTLTQSEIDIRVVSTDE